MRAGTGRTHPLLTAQRKMRLCTALPCELPLPPARPLVLDLGQAPGAALAQGWTVALSRRLVVRGPAPCPPPAPGPTHTMTGLMIRLSAQRRASTQECRETKVFPPLDAVCNAPTPLDIVLSASFQFRFCTSYEITVVLFKLPAHLIIG